MPSSNSFPFSVTTSSLCCSVELTPYNRSRNLHVTQAWPVIFHLLMTLASLVIGMQFNTGIFTGIIEKDKLLHILLAIKTRKIDAWSCWKLPYGEQFLENDVNVDEKEEENWVLSIWCLLSSWIHPYLKVCTLHQENQIPFVLKSVWVRCLSLATTTKITWLLSLCSNYNPQLIT